MIQDAPSLRQLRDCAKGAAVRHVKRAKQLGFRHMLLSFEESSDHLGLRVERPAVCIAHGIAPEVHRQWASTRFRQDPMRRMKASGDFAASGNKPLLWENRQGRIILPTGTPTMTAVEMETMRWVYDYGMRTGVNVRLEVAGREVSISFYSERPREEIAGLDDAMAILFYLSHMIVSDLKEELTRDVMPTVVKLTRRETECLHWVAQGKNAQETAVILGLSVQTIRDHLKHVRSKMGATTRAQALMRACSLGLIDFPQ